MGEAGIPVFRYGTHTEALQALRRRLGYFERGMLPRPCDPRLCTGSAAGPDVVDPDIGICCVGDAPWVVNYNVPIHTADAAVAAVIARAASARYGGLPAVESLALPHRDGLYEVACNILDAAVSPPLAVERAVQRAAAACHVRVGEGYQLNMSAAEALAHVTALEAA